MARGSFELGRAVTRLDELFERSTRDPSGTPDGNCSKLAPLNQRIKSCAANGEETCSIANGQQKRGVILELAKYRHRSLNAVTERVIRQSFEQSLMAAETG